MQCVEFAATFDENHENFHTAIAQAITCMRETETSARSKKPLTIHATYDEQQGDAVRRRHGGLALHANVLVYNDPSLRAEMHPQRQYAAQRAVRLRFGFLAGDVRRRTAMESVSGAHAFA